MGEKGNVTSEELASSLVQQAGGSLRSTIIDKTADAAVESVRERLTGSPEEPGINGTPAP